MALNRGTSTYFRNYTSPRPQDLLERLLIESIKRYGMDMLYVPRVIDQEDPIFNEDGNSRYEKAIPIEMYVKNSGGFGGDGPLMHNFGYEIRDQIIFTCARRIFEQEITSVTQELRPKTGDLIFFPLQKKCFVIRYVDYKPIFYQLGALAIYDLTCETFEYSSEQFSTGVKDIDDIQREFSTAAEDWALKDSDGNILTDEDGNILIRDSYAAANTPLGDSDQSQKFQNEQANNTFSDDSDDVVDWDEKDPFSVNGKY